MKAIVYHEYGTPDVLQLAEVDEPVATGDQVLIRVRAAAVNPGDWFLLNGMPYLLRLESGLRHPKREILGLAVSGEVAGVGDEVTAFGAGDEVYAEVKHGGFAEYVCASHDAVAPKPTNLSFGQAAAVPVVGPTALQGLRDVARVREGQHVLVTGASGGVGSFAVQIAKALGAEVSGECSAKNVDLVRSLGADHVIDYTQEDFTAGDGRYDLIFDNVGNRPLLACRRVLTRRGMLIPNSQKHGRVVGDYLTRAARALLLSPFVSQTFRPFSASGSNDYLVSMTELIEAGEVTPVIDGTYPLGDAADALTHYGTRHTRGKVVITI